MVIFLELLLAFLALGALWLLLRRLLRPRAPAEPADDPFALVSAPLKRGPKGRSGAVAVEEPDDDDAGASYPPRTV